ncbi:estradiol 17-beta-dehydrogenase 11 [Tribolium madens]|uniref:estradiol 17-beta-dehydrogenase 11 n=1 Tax=Tribolium madens TaxID=41895 RepID=UPI001CF75EA8|nr:estradiol 17-beta-dehydrogenase 11 [Tribolium madens]
MAKADLLKSLMDVVGFLVLCLVVIVKSVVKSLLPASYQHFKKLKGEIILITGGGGGLGRLLALRLARLDAIVVLWDVNVKAVEETVELVKGIGGVAYGFKCDLADKEDVYKIANTTRQEVGEVTILINNAGIVSGNLLLNTPDHLIKRTFDVNILAHFWTVKAFLPHMIEKNHGHIVTIASMAGFVGINKLVDYCASKHAAVGFDEALRVELEAQGVDGVKTTVVCPYFIQSTGMFDNVNSRFLPTLKSNDVADRIVEGLRKEEIVVMIPGVFKTGIIFKFLFPWACISMFLRGLVPDAAPHHHLPVQTSEKSDFTTKSDILKSSLASLDQREGISGKNL